MIEPSYSVLKLLESSFEIVGVFITYFSLLHQKIILHRRMGRCERQLYKSVSAFSFSINFHVHTLLLLCHENKLSMKSLPEISSI